MLNKKVTKFEVAEIIIDLPALELNRAFDYKIPTRFKNKISIGQTVLVPFGRRKELGFVAALKEKSPFPKLEEIEEIVEEEPFLNQWQIELISWLADYYLASLSESIRLALPPGRSRRLEIFYHLSKDSPSTELNINSAQQQRIIDFLINKTRPISQNELRAEFKGKIPSSALNQLEKKKMIVKYHRLKEPVVSPKDISFARIKPGLIVQENLDKIPIRAVVQKRIFEYLLENRLVPVSHLLNVTNGNYSSITGLKEKGLIEIISQEIERKPENYYLEEVKVPERLTKEQEIALREVIKAIRSGKSETLLLDGVTGSGKTEIYLQAAENVLNGGKSVIILVPEISLTPQTLRRFQVRLNCPVALLHSGLGLGERYDQFRRIKNGHYRVVLGTRSALFSPVQNLGLIIIDEEHETSYKQNNNPRYEAGGVARKLSQLKNITLILGSATPSIESYQAGQSGRYKYLRLAKRVEDKQLPSIEIINLTDERKTGNQKALSLKLKDEVTQRLENNEKIILFLNRRGFSSFIMCPDCGYVAHCPNCQISLTYHRSYGELICHHCDFHQDAPENCPQCDSHDFKYAGIGTEQVEQEILDSFTGWPVIRMDRDTVSGKDKHRQKLLQFMEAKGGILLGTQMIAKGLHIPQVTLVGVINADTALNLPDFRAAERTFQVLMQVAGRAGRGEIPGKVIIQTYQPDNYALKAVAEGDYRKFYEQEIAFRQELNYPPFSNLINITAGGLRETDSKEIINDLGDMLTRQKVGFLGPSQSPLYRLRGTYRWHLLIKTQDTRKAGEQLRNNLDNILAKARKKQVTISIDVDPNWLL